MQLITKTGEIQESFTAVLTFQSQPISTISFMPVPLQRNEQSVHEISFTSPYELMASKAQKDATELVSFLKIIYSLPTTTPGTLDASLGYGYSVPTDIPCKSLKGLNPITGNNINCTLYPGTTPYVVVKNYATLPINGEVLLYLPHKKNPTGRVDFELRLTTKENRLLNVISTSPVQTVDFTVNTTCNSS